MKKHFTGAVVAALSVATATPALAAVQVFNGSGFAIADAGGTLGSPIPTTSSSSFVVGSLGSINSVTISLNEFSHTFAGDLIARLSNGTTTVDLFDRLGVPQTTFGNGNNFVGTYSFADANASLLPESGAIAPGAYKSAQALSAFNGQDTAGNWTLSIIDNSPQDTGNLRSWSLTLDYGTNGAVPEPATWAMMILGFGLIGAAMRRRQAKVRYAFA